MINGRLVLLVFFESIFHSLALQNCDFAFLCEARTRMSPKTRPVISVPNFAKP